MKILIRSDAGGSIPIALRLESEGNIARIAITGDADEDYDKIGNGLVDKVEYTQANVDWADLVVFDGNGFDLPKEAENLRKHGHHVVGSSDFAGKLENDRSFAIQVAKNAGIDVPEIREFAGHAAWDDAKRYVVKLGSSDKKLVWKPNGEAPASTFVAESSDEMLEMFPYWRELFAEHSHNPSFIITDAIEGEEISTEGWFNGKQFYFPNHTLERTRFFDGDHGEKTGCAGNVVWHDDTPLYHELFDNLAPFFAGRYNGPIDINTIIDKRTNQPVFLEFTPRFGYDAIFGLMEILESDLAELFYECAYGKDISGSVVNKFSGAVRVHVPPYPEPSAEDDKLRPVGLPIFGMPLNKVVRSGYYPVEVMLQSYKFVTTGPDGYVLVVAGTGNSPREATEVAYQRVNKIRIPTARWRMDLAVKFQDIYNTVIRTGWLGQINRKAQAPVKSSGVGLFKRAV